MPCDNLINIANLLIPIDFLHDPDSANALDTRIERALSSWFQIGSNLPWDFEESEVEKTESEEPDVEESEIVEPEIEIHELDEAEHNRSIWFNVAENFTGLG